MEDILMVSPKSRREALQTTAQKIFVDREKFQEAFEKALVRKPEETYKVLVYYGVGGIGKTSLIEQLQGNLASINPNAICVSLDFKMPQSRQQDEALAQLVNMLRTKYKIPLPTYDIAYSFYWKKIHPNQALTANEIPFFEDGSMISDIISTLGDMPVVGVVPKIAKIVFKGHSYIQTWWTLRGEKTLRELETMKPQEILDELPIYFAQDFAEYLKKKNQPAVIFFDTYEALWENNRDVGHYMSRDAWIRDLIAELPLPENILWVICGRERVRWEDIKNDNWSDYIGQHLIGNLADPDIRDFLNNRGITDSKIQDAIVKSSEGVPFYLDLTVEIYRNEPESQADKFTGTHDELLERFL
jgi:GTPase SAR1 family protein